jgi:hypothetical protein
MPVATAGPGVLELSAAIYTVAPAAGAVTITVNRVGGSSGIAVATYGTVGGSAVAGTDYTPAFGTLAWGDGDSAPKTFTVGIAPGGPGGAGGAGGAGATSFTVALLSASGAGFGAPIDATVSLAAATTVATPGALELSAAGYDVTQNEGAVTVTVNRIGGSNGIAIATFGTFDGSAVAGTDYTASFGTLTWPDGDATPRTFTVPVSPGGTGAKSFTVALLSASGAGFGDPIDATVLVAAASAAATPGRLELSASGYNVAPHVGAVTVTVERVGGSSGIATASYGTFNGSAVAGTDYEASFGTLTWADGDTTPRAITVPIEPGGGGARNFTVALLSASGAGFGNPIDAVVAIGAQTSGAPLSIQVQGNQLVSTLNGGPVQIVGTQISGLETGYSSRWPQYSNAGVLFWSSLINYGGSGLNTVRLPLNEASWLNYTCYDSGSGASAKLYAPAAGGGYTPDPNNAYQATVKQAVADATAAGLYVILVDFWGAPNNAAGQPLCPIGQPGFANADHSFAFWRSVADTFKGNPAVMFELFNEPFGANVYNDWVIQSGSNTYTPGTDAITLRDGGAYYPFDTQDNTDGNAMVTVNETWQVAGMQDILDTIRGEGASNVVLASPMGWAGEIETWLASRPTDPIGQLGAAWHLYGYAKGTAPPLAVLAAGFPIVITETYGFDAAVDGGASANGYSWAAANGIGYAWCCWNDWGMQSSLGVAFAQEGPPWYMAPAP